MGALSVEVFVLASNRTKLRRGRRRHGTGTAQSVPVVTPDQPAVLKAQLPGLGTLSVTVSHNKQGSGQPQDIVEEAERRHLLEQLPIDIEKTVSDPQWRTLVEEALEAVRPGSCCQNAKRFFRTCLRLTYYPLPEEDRETVIRVAMVAGALLADRGWDNAIAWLLDQKIGRDELARLLKGSKWSLVICGCSDGPGYHVAEPEYCKPDSKFVEV